MTADGIISAIIIGAIIGVLGPLVVPGRLSSDADLAHHRRRHRRALLGSAIAKAIGVETTPGVDWTEIFIQVVLAAIGVALVAGRQGPAEAVMLIFPDRQPGYADKSA